MIWEMLHLNPEKSGPNKKWAEIAVHYCLLVILSTQFFKNCKTVIANNSKYSSHIVILARS